MKDISQLNDRDFAIFYHNLLQRIKRDPIEHFVKDSQLINFQPSPAQSVALKCVFGQPLDALILHDVWTEVPSTDGTFHLEVKRMTEVQLYEYMTGAVYDPNDETIKNRIDLIVGRRGGKSTISSILSLFFASTENWKPFLKKHPYATVIILSHSNELSEEILDLIRILIEDSPVLSRLIDKGRRKKDRQNVFHLAIPFFDENGEIVYSKVAIRVGSARKKTVRGKATCVILCDEIAFWNLAEESADPDVDIIRAARPALMQFGDKGLLIKLSSPGIKQGILYNEYQTRQKELANPDTKERLPANYVIFKAPSWVWNNILREQDYQEEYQLDPTGFASEYRADFVDSISNFIAPEFVDKCVLKGVTFNPPEVKMEDAIYQAAIDAAFKGDRFTFTIVGSVRGKVKQYVMRGWEGTRAKPVKAAEVAAFIKTALAPYGITKVHADQYAFQPLREIFAQYGIDLQEKTFTNTFKRKIFFNLKKLIHNQQLDLLHNDELIKEIKQLQVEQSNTGVVRIGHPPGLHDDYAAATAVATFVVTEDLTSTRGDMVEMAGLDFDMEAQVNRPYIAPIPSQLGNFFGYEVEDNSSLYKRNPQTGQLERRTESDDDDDEGGGGFDFSF